MILRHGIRHISVLVAFSLVSFQGASSYGFDGEHPAATVAATKSLHGRVQLIDGVSVLQVWGTPQERGYAQGYTFAPQIIQLINRYLESEDISGGTAAYEKTLILIGLMMNVPQSYQEELHGMLEGIEAKLEGETTIAALNRKLLYNDLVAINCIPDYVGFGCSSFVAWGDLTNNGNTIAGRNLDWFRIVPLMDQQIVLVNAADESNHKVGWVSITWPGMIGCLTGMNSEGVTLAMHDVPGKRPSSKFGFTPRGFILRDAIEAAHPKSAIQDVTSVLRKRTCAVGNNVVVSVPHQGKASAGFVCEYDGHLEDKNGVTLRRPRVADAGDREREDYMLCTNHYCLRSDPDNERCSRYEDLQRSVSSAEAKGMRLSVDSAWGLLKDVSQPRRDGSRFITYHSVVFEPNTLKMHVAFCSKDQTAPFNNPIDLDVPGLLRSTSALSNSSPVK